MLFAYGNYCSIECLLYLLFTLNAIFHLGAKQSIYRGGSACE